MTRVEKMTRIEDFNLGRSIEISPGFSPRSLTGKDDTSDLIASYRKNYSLFKTHLLMTQIGYSSRQTFEDTNNERFLIDAKYYHRHSSLQTFVFRSHIEWGEDLDPDNQVLLGGNSGLRSFQEDGIVGEKSFLLNLEDRLFFTDEVLNLFALGGVVFLDTGYVWPEGQPVALSQLRTDMGLGLRLGLTRSSNEVIVRVDFAKRLHRINSQDNEWIFTFGSGQAF